MNLITFDIITNFCNYDDMEVINNRKKSEKIGKNQKKIEKFGKRSYARYTDWNNTKEPKNNQLIISGFKYPLV